MISVVRALTAVTVLRLNQTYERLREAQDLLKRIDQSLRRVFAIYPAGDPAYIKEQQKFERMIKQKILPKQLLVFLSSNKEFYGDLILNIAEIFIADLKKTGSDGLVIGAIGKKILEREKVSSKIYYFDLDDDRPNLAVIGQIMAVLENYNQVVVYHGRAESMFRQFPVKSQVDRDTPPTAKPSKKYFFEPTPLEVLEFLKKQIATNSFHQKLYEGHMARLSARRWNWTKQQLTRSRLLEELTYEFKMYKKGLITKQQQVTIFAHRLNIAENDILKGSRLYG